MLSQNDLRNLVRIRCEAAGSQSAFAKEVGMSNQMISFILSGGREVSTKLAKKMGYKRKVVYTPCHDKVDGA